MGEFFSFHFLYYFPPFWKAPLTPFPRVLGSIIASFGVEEGEPSRESLASKVQPVSINRSRSHRQDCGYLNLALLSILINRKKETIFLIPAKNCAPLLGEIRGQGGTDRWLVRNGIHTHTHPASRKCCVVFIFSAFAASWDSHDGEN